MGAGSGADRGGRPRIKAVLFDIDGTLVDSNDLHVAAWLEAFAQHGDSFDAQTVHDQIGKGADNLVPALIPGISETEQKKLDEAHGKSFKGKFLAQVKAFPKARELLRHVSAAGQKIVFASSASQEELEHYLGMLEAKDIVSATTSADDVERTKPAPDIFATALKKVAPLTPAEVMVVGDTPYDVRAAAKCGIAAIGMRSGKFADEALRAAGAVALYDDVAALLAGYSSSPLGR